LESSEDEKDPKKVKKAGIFSRFSNSVKSLTGNKVQPTKTSNPSSPNSKKTS